MLSTSDLLVGTFSMSRSLLVFNCIQPTNSASFWVCGWLGESKGRYVEHTLGSFKIHLNWGSLPMLQVYLNTRKKLVYYIEILLSFCILYLWHCRAPTNLNSSILMNGWNFIASTLLPSSVSAGQENCGELRMLLFFRLWTVRKKSVLVVPEIFSREDKLKLNISSLRLILDEKMVSLYCYEEGKASSAMKTYGVEGKMDGSFFTRFL